MTKTFRKIVPILLLFVFLISACQEMANEALPTETPMVLISGSSNEEEMQEPESDREEVQSTPIPENTDEPEEDPAFEEETPVPEGVVPPEGVWIMTHGAGTYTCEGVTYDFPATEPETVTLEVAIEGDAIKIIPDEAPDDALIMLRVDSTVHASVYVGDRIIEGAEFLYTLDYFGDNLMSGFMEGTTVEENCDVERIIFLEFSN